MAYLRHQNGVITDGPFKGRPSLATADRMCEAILALSGCTNGRVAAAGFAALEKRTGQPFVDLIQKKPGSFAYVRLGGASTFLHFVEATKDFEIAPGTIVMAGDAWHWT